MSAWIRAFIKCRSRTDIFSNKYRAEMDKNVGFVCVVSNGGFAVYNKGGSPILAFYLFIIP